MQPRDGLVLGDAGELFIEDVHLFESGRDDEVDRAHPRRTPGHSLENHAGTARAWGRWGCGRRRFRAGGHVSRRFGLRGGRLHVAGLDVMKQRTILLELGDDANLDLASTHHRLVEAVELECVLHGCARGGVRAAILLDAQARRRADWGDVRRQFIVAHGSSSS